MTINSQQKGKRFERKVAHLLSQIWHNARRVPFNQAHKGSDGCDVEGTPYWLECKHGKRPNIRAAMQQAVEATDGRPPVVITRRNGEDILVTMKLDDWVDLWMKLQNSG